ncbi:uncharacterized protein LOC125809975 [Solanum verrucosum]|uniref:uncharacterized protein LOC125809975 n=1 Tax=Solanum verrucosum TaxID=315347 RepID=UPI0020D1A039|nr:uncharacterized protein LOC125809975 [Solanum verrucosum]
MKTYLEGLDLWEAVEEDYEINLLPNNPTVPQIKSHKEKKTIKSKAKATFFVAVSTIVFTKIMTLTSPKEIWNYLKKEYAGDERIRGMKVLNLMREFELQRMKESEIVKKYFDILLGIVNKEQMRLMRQHDMVEGALVASHKTQSRGNFLKNCPPCQHCGQNGHPPYKCWKRPNAQCKICKQLGHEAVICKNKFQKVETIAQVTSEEEEEEEEEDHLFVATYFSTKKSDF